MFLYCANSFSTIAPALNLIAMAVLAARFTGSPMLIGCLNYLILSFMEGKIIEIIGDLDNTDP